MRKFIQCGFEFTASQKAKSRLKSKTLHAEFGAYIHRKTELYFDSFGQRNNLRRIHDISEFPWISENFSSDDCGCEVSTPIIKTKDEAIRHFNEFQLFVDTNNLTVDPDLAMCGLGGCHIHLGLETIPQKQRKLFFQNVIVFLTNNPQLNWGFNDPNDNINANNLLEDISEDKDGIRSRTDSFSSVRYERHKILMDMYDKATSVLKAVLKYPFEIELHKKFSIRYNEEYKTIELRIFDMPRTLEQHILHSDVAQAIFHHCLAKTKKGILARVEYKSQADYKVPLKEAKRKFTKVMKDLGVDIKRTRHQIKAMELRYEWNKMSKEEDYLL